MKKTSVKMYRIMEGNLETEYFNIILGYVKDVTVSP